MSDTTRPAPVPHALPRLFEWVQDHVLLSALLLAEAYLLGDLMARGWVANIEDPGPGMAHWGMYHGVGVVLFFAAGATAAGVALRCSVAAANALQQTPRRWGTGLFNLLGVTAFALCEIWASLSERSALLAPTPADTAVLSLLGVSGWPVSPTVVIVALLLPFATLYYGFSRVERPEGPSLAEQTRAHERALAQARFRAQLRQVQAGGVRGTLGALAGRQASVDAPDDEPPDGPVGGPGGGRPVREGAAGPGRFSAAKNGARTGRITALRPHQGGRPRPHGPRQRVLSAQDVVAYIRRVYGVDYPVREAREQIIRQCVSARATEGTGRPLVAPAAQVYQHVSVLARRMGWTRRDAQSAG